MSFQVQPLLAGIGCALLASLLVAQTETFVPPSDVSFKVSTAQTSWKAGESITLKCRVKNISNAVLFVPREWEATCPASPHLWASFEDSAGKHFVGGYSGDCMPTPQTIRERMNKEAVLLKPGEHLDAITKRKMKLPINEIGNVRTSLPAYNWWTYRGLLLTIQC